MFPATEPYDSGLLDVGDGHRIYWETCGNPHGAPAVFLHGGPGGGSSPGHRRFFDPDLFRAVLFDQRGANRSRPRASEPVTDLSTNTTPHLVADLERLREHLGIDRWVVFGVSWGTTLGLAYAETHPSRIAGLVLGLVTTCTRREVEWMTVDMGRMYPRQWSRFRSAVPESLRHLPLIEAYATLTADPDPAVHQPAADEWNAWDHTQSAVPPNAKYDDPAVRLEFARLVTHYWRHAAFVEDGRLMRDAVLLNGIPGALIAGAHDMSCPPDIPWQLSRRWTSGELIVVDAAHGHSETDPEAFPNAVIATLHKLAHA
ncbi:MAG TPA: prolyl aminopeptidase [Pseudonocardiaceae bacterium]|nr:prolyl aminopeptidase [Pseudonocardiaceae bacterium]